jgi:alkylation response protein AidB-like acyl-CoA dehydrogenase
MLSFSDRNQRLRSAIEARAERLPERAADDGSRDLPADAWRAVADAGLLSEPAEDTVSKGERLLGTMYALERLGELATDGGFAFAVVSHLAGTVTPLAGFGSAEAKTRYLPDLTAGRAIGAHAISEPEAGSDAGAMTTTAVPADGGYRLDGDKAYVTNGPIADLVTVYARLAGGPGDGRLGAFLVETGQDGVRVGAPLDTMALGTAPLAPLRLDGVRVPAGRMVGRPGSGFLVLDHVLKREVLYAFIVSVGQMARRLAQSVEQARIRRQFGQRIGQFQSVSNRLADMKLHYEVSRRWLYHAAEVLAAGRDATTEVAIAKILASENALSSALDAMHLHGGRGYLHDSGLPGDLAEAVAGPIYSGTNDVQRNRIAAMMGV